MLSPLPEAPGQEALGRLMVQALDYYPEFLGRLEEREGRERIPLRRGTLLVARTPEELQELLGILPLCRELGLEARRLDGAALRGMEPGLGPGIVGGLHLPQVGWLEHRRLLRACRLALEHRGVGILPEAATCLVGSPQRVEGVGTPRGWIRAAWVVNAAGAWAGAFLGTDRSGAAPVRPVKGQAFSLLCRRVPSRVLRAPSVYLVPNPEAGRILVGSTMEDVGFQPGCTAGALERLLREGRELFPELAEGRLEEHWWGFRPDTPDHLPVLGPGGPAGLVHAAGLFRSGILLAPWVGRLVAELLTVGAPPEALEPFSPTRFAAQG
jgi:glycine/D-amino acid oxidase-like deaminating enzyme